jgi:OFA family oxalate/formate antiporter-like MFS transporter
MDIMKSKGYPVVVASIIIMLCLGVAYSWGVFVKPIETELGWSRAQISLAVSILLLVFSAFMFIGGVIEKKIGASRTVTIAGVLMAIAWVGASFSRSPLWLYVFYGIFGGIATGLSYIPSVSCGIKWYPHKKGLITGIIIFGFGFGSAILSPLMTRLVQLIGWRSAMLYSGIVFGTIIVVSARFLKQPKVKSEVSSTDSSAEEGALTPKDMLRTSTFWILFITYFIAMIAGMMTIGHVVAFASDRGFSVMHGALALTVLSIFNGLGRVLAGHMSDGFGGKTILITLFLIIAGAMFIFPSAQNLAMFYLVAAVIGICFGGFLAVYPPLTANYFGQENFSVNYGLVFIGYGTGCFLGPVIGGHVHDIMSSYHVAFYASGCLAVFGAFMVFKLLQSPNI